MSENQKNMDPRELERLRVDEQRRLIWDALSGDRKNQEWWEQAQFRFNRHLAPPDFRGAQKLVELAETDAHAAFALMRLSQPKPQEPDK